MTTILTTGLLASWGPIAMTITGNADWDTYLFSKLKAKELSEDQAKALWTYTDGYRVKLTATNPGQFNPNKLSTGVTEAEYQAACAGAQANYANPGPSKANALAGTYCPVQTNASKTQAQVDAGAAPDACQFCRQTFCVTKSAAANSVTNFDDKLENQGSAADGYYCFEMDRARLDFMQYWASGDFASVGMASGAKAKWEVVFQGGRAVNRIAESTESGASKDGANPYNNQAAIFTGAGTAASITQAVHSSTTKVNISTLKATGTAAPASLAAGKASLDVSWYQPKWQKNDYYQYNFRINYLDSVTVKYCAYDLTDATTAGKGVAGAAGASGAAYYPRMLGMLPVVYDRIPDDQRRTTSATSYGRGVVTSNCAWTTTSAVATAGPKAGAANLAASLTALALGATVLAF